MDISIPNNWKRRDYQAAAWDAWTAGKKRELLFWHRRAGKDDYALNKTAVSMMSTGKMGRVGNYWHCLPQYSQARKAIWEAVDPHTGKRRIDQAFPKKLRKRTDNTSMVIECFNGSIWRVVGSDNPDSLVGAPPVGLVFSEWALSNPAAWGYLSPILLENGGWASFITTPRGNNHAKKMLDAVKNDPKWFSQVLGIRDTMAINEDLVEEQRATYHSLFGPEVGDMLIEQEFHCSFAGALIGSYYGGAVDKAEREGRIKLFEIDRKHPVHTAWDLGKNKNNVIWCFQVINQQLYIVDFHNPVEGDLETWCAWLKERGYHGDDFVPHDVMTEEWGTRRTRRDYMISMGRKPKRVASVAKADGINAGRIAISKAIFHSKNVADGIEGLRNYRREWDDEKKVFKDTPVKDWADHIADGWRYLALAYNDVAPKIIKPPTPTSLQYTVGNDGVMRGNVDVRKAVELMMKRKRNAA
ncbi:MAG: hypothetical protein ACRC6I_18160 [Paracoccaceae bacterium]